MNIHDIPLRKVLTGDEPKEEESTNLAPIAVSVALYAYDIRRDRLAKFGKNGCIIILYLLACDLWDI